MEKKSRKREREGERTEGGKRRERRYNQVR
jgi:hypothetical protein